MGMLGEAGGERVVWQMRVGVGVWEMEQLERWEVGMEVLV